MAARRGSRALTRGLDARLGEWQAGAGAAALPVEDRGDLLVGVVLGEPTDQLDRVLAESWRSGPRALSLTASSAARAALPGDLDLRLSLLVR